MSDLCFFVVLTPVGFYFTSLQFLDGSSEVELRLQLGGQNIQSTRDIFVDANGTSLTIEVQHSGSLITLMETNHLFDKIKPAETIWFVKLKAHEII